MRDEALQKQSLDRSRREFSVNFAGDEAKTEAKYVRYLQQLIHRTATGPGGKEPVYNRLSAVFNDRKNIFYATLSRTARVWMDPDTGQTVFHAVAVSDDIDLAKVLAAHAVRVIKPVRLTELLNRPDIHGKTALDYADRDSPVYRYLAGVGALQSANSGKRNNILAEEDAERLNLSSKRQRVEPGPVSVSVSDSGLFRRQVHFHEEQGDDFKAEAGLPGREQFVSFIRDNLTEIGALFSRADYAGVNKVGRNILGDPLFQENWLNLQSETQPASAPEISRCIRHIELILTDYFSSVCHHHFNRDTALCGPGELLELLEPCHELIEVLQRYMQMKNDAVQWLVGVNNHPDTPGLLRRMSVARMNLIHFMESENRKEQIQKCAGLAWIFLHNMTVAFHNKITRIERPDIRSINRYAQLLCDISPLLKEIYSSVPGREQEMKDWQALLESLAGRLDDHLVTPDGQYFRERKDAIQNLINSLDHAVAAAQHFIDLHAVSEPESSGTRFCL